MAAWTARTTSPCRVIPTRSSIEARSSTPRPAIGRWRATDSNAGSPAGPRGHQHEDRVRSQAAYGEGQRISARVVEPMDVVDDHDEWPFLSGRGENTECRGAQSEAIGPGAVAQAARGLHRTALAGW